MGSRSNINLAYIAGFLDGDGSLMLQLKKRNDRSKGFRFMATICFYQDTRHEQSLHWIKKIFGIGYISRRNDGMTELRINGFNQTNNILRKLLPFIKFKRKQANILYKAIRILINVRGKQLKRKQLVQLVNYIIAIQNENYVTKRKKSKEEFLSMLGLTP
ncbi:LAGLIDADG family homing endonuclease [Candidatus Peregrinibacteria bacterium]|nr:LAGLIDADG family homing endonuclease [Candidatus Peregrinibacteria bacterium]